MSAGKVAVVDAWAILAFLRAEEPGATAMRRYLRRAQSGNLRLLLNLVNLGEVFYRLLQLTGEEQAEERLGQVKALPIDIVPVRESLVLEAARIKSRHPLSYADSFAVATGRLENAPVLTGDPEILSLPATVVRIRRLDRHA
ncbi:MAG TPA: type II toxin-antitoxin system VapC family toxin [Thermoanaerobaculia bacterium]|nr:type II toxin-antitoxin system VapC family toxin [Thermoanaerobaculia bacterium]